MTKTLSTIAAAAACALAGAAHAQSTVYSNDFDAPAIVGAGVVANFVDAGGALQSTIAPYDSYGQFFRNSSTGLTELQLSNLGAHSSVHVSFTLAFIDSWDSRDGGPAPDNLDLYINGELVHSYTYNNASGSIKDIGGGSLVAEYVQFDPHGFFGDTVVDMSGDPLLNFVHHGGTLTIGWQASGAGWQGGIDEAWGIDNLNVTVDGVVPEPSTYALMFAGLAAMGAFARRRKS